MTLSILKKLIFVGEGLETETKGCKVNFLAWVETAVFGLVKIRDIRLEFY